MSDPWKWRWQEWREKMVAFNETTKPLFRESLRHGPAKLIARH
jgi:hypothetical protein